MFQLYLSLQDASSDFVYSTSVLILIYAILLTISNLSLIRHEGFRFANALGILLSFGLVFGIVFLTYFSGAIQWNTDFQIKVWGVLTQTLATAYAIMECFLIGAVLCGTIAAKHKPDYNKDYIVILGCQIKKDGTLYPLIRGRVDRAIRFYQEQYQATGKKAIFIPSGGQGSDEIISEGEAMKRYLLENGIESDQILAETKSINTRENMLFSGKLMKKDTKAVFSTTNYHVFRSGIISRQVGLDLDGMGSPTKWYFWPNAYIREMIGMVTYKWKSLILLFLPIVAFLTVIRFVFSF